MFFIFIGKSYCLQNCLILSKSFAYLLCRIAGTNNNTKQEIQVVRAAEARSRDNPKAATAGRGLMEKRGLRLGVERK